MNKKLLFAATVAAMLASCSSDDLSVQTAAKQEAQGLENVVSFEALSQRSLTRAGYAGAMDNAKLQEQGFGVFGYYTDLNEYDQTSTPNFMYNQKVSGANWTYEPVKYWPNEYGSNAQSDDVDKLTFFAYAPYTENAPATGKVTEDQVGITGFTRATAAGDPYVKYVGSLDPLKCVDLCWGVADPNQNVTWNIIQGGSQTMTAGMPWMNVQRPQKSLGQKMKFFFKHALAQLNVQIDADVNTNKHGEGAEVDSKSKVYVRSITFNGFAMKGALNLNNEDANTPNWKGYNCNNEPIVTEEYTIYDGMKDGKEGTGYTASNEKVTGLNEKIIQDKAWNQSAEGVTKTAKNLFNNTGDNPQVTDPIYVIPTGDNMNVTIVYDIETEDANLAGTVSDGVTPGVSIENKISKTITLTSGDAMKLEAGKKYTIQLHLGLSQVEFDATVDEWDGAAAAAGEAWLPENGEAEADNGVDLSQATLGMIVASNGKAYTVDNYDASYGDRVAVVAKPGYAIALQNSDSQTWNEITDNGTNKDIDLDLPESKRGSVPAAPAGTTWKILNKANYISIFEAMGSTTGQSTGKTYDGSVNAFITAAGGDALDGQYWSTQDADNDKFGWSFTFGAWSYGYIFGGLKSTSYNVRPVLAW